jgi:predicted RND superfamily exporter protein
MLMALVLFLMREYFHRDETFDRISELVIMISVGLLVYFISSYFSGSLNILIRSNIFKRKKNDIVPES